MREYFRRASMSHLSGAPALHPEDAPSRRGRRSHGRPKFEANHLERWPAPNRIVAWHMDRMSRRKRMGQEGHARLSVSYRSYPAAALDLSSPTAP